MACASPANSPDALIVSWQKCAITRWLQDFLTKTASLEEALTQLMMEKQQARFLCLPVCSLPSLTLL